MSSQRGASLPPPPWTQAPAEVEAWLASTGGRRRASSGRAPRQARVRGFVGACSPAREHRLFRQLERYGFHRIEGTSESVTGTFERLAHRAPLLTFRGTLAGADVRIGLREGTEDRVRLTFMPRLTVRNASKVLLRLGLDPFRGHWL